MTTSETSEPSSGSLRLQVGTGVDIDGSVASELLALVLFDLGALAVSDLEALAVSDLGAQAVGDQSTPDTTVLLAGFDTVDLARSAQAHVLEHHSHLVASVVVEEVLAATWVSSQRDGLEPTQIGPWYIRGPWHAEPDPRTVDAFHDIVIDPGVAFGHGSHPTTRLAIELMLRHLTPEAAASTTVVDLGTGTGVAAIIAARLGATVRAVEKDTDACEAAWFNIERNSTAPFDDTAERIQLVNADAADAQIDAGDLVIANVTLGIHRHIAAQASRAQRVVASGLLCHQVRDLQAIDQYSGNLPSTIRVNGDWAAVDFSSIAVIGRKT